MTRAPWIVKLGAFAIPVFLVIAHAFRIDQTNEAVIEDLDAPVHVKKSMKRTCYGCHSSETVWPWCNAIAPALWMAAHDVHEGRAEQNFSSGSKYTAARRREMLTDID